MVRGLIISFLLFPLVMRAQMPLLPGVLDPVAPVASSAPTFVSSTSCTAATTTCTVTGLSIPASDHLVFAVGTEAGNGTITFADSNLDTVQLGTAVEETTDGSWSRMGVTITGATITTVTCASVSSADVNCWFGWYSGGSSTVSAVACGTGGGSPLDRCAQADNPDTGTFSSGTTGALATATETVVGMFTAPNTGTTFTLTDGSTSRYSSTTLLSIRVSDRAASSTSGVAATSTCSITYGTANVITIR